MDNFNTAYALTRNILGKGDVYGWSRSGSMCFKLDYASTKNKPIRQFIHVPYFTLSPLLENNIEDLNEVMDVPQIHYQPYHVPMWLQIE